AYHQLLEEVTFYRYTDTDMSGQVTGLATGDDPHAAQVFAALRQAPAIFAAAGPSCVACGHCTEGKMSCGKQKEVQAKYAAWKEKL
ncbi:MAG: hypothetical protein LIP23_01090, partial [Planctomycetes bacterium]|nr:hypothetical protein [Planctomycetota bacterium]